MINLFYKFKLLFLRVICYEKLLRVALFKYLSLKFPTFRPHYESLIFESAKNAIKLGGTTIKDHIQPDGNLGYFKQNLKVYGRTNDKCLDCSGKIKEIKQLGRSSFFCVSCQK